MDVTLFPLEPDAACRRFFIRADGQHAGGITVHSVRGNRFSYGIAITPSLRRRGIAGAALHRSLGFEVASKDISAITLKKSL